MLRDNVPFWLKWGCIFGFFSCPAVPRPSGQLMQEAPRLPWTQLGRRLFGQAAGPSQWAASAASLVAGALSSSADLRIGDLISPGGQRPSVYQIDPDQWEEHALVDIVPPADLRLYELLAARRPVGRSHLATVADREACVLLAAAFFLGVRRSQIEVFTTQGPSHALTPPCSRCALPTGCWCDICGRPLCTQCDDEGITACCAACSPEPCRQP